MIQPRQLHNQKARWTKTGQDIRLQWESGLYPNKVYVFFGEASTDGSGYIDTNEVEYLENV